MAKKDAAAAGDAAAENEAPVTAQADPSTLAGQPAKADAPAGDAPVAGPKDPAVPQPHWLLETPDGEVFPSDAETVQDAIREMNGDGGGKVWTYRSLKITDTTKAA
jgi:hypothetical protein